MKAPLVAFVLLLALSANALVVKQFGGVPRTYPHLTAVFGPRPGTYMAWGRLVIATPSDLCSNMTNVPDLSAWNHTGGALPPPPGSGVGSGPSPHPNPHPNPNPNPYPPHYPGGPRPGGGHAGAGAGAGAGGGNGMWPRPQNRTRGFVAVALRGGCTFLQKAQWAQAAGARALIVVSNTNEPVQMGAMGDTSAITIPVVSIGNDAYTAIQAAITAGGRACARIDQQGDLALTEFPSHPGGGGDDRNGGDDDNDGIDDNDPDSGWSHHGGGHRGGRRRFRWISTLLLIAAVIITVCICRRCCRRRQQLANLPVQHRVSPAYTPLTASGAVPPPPPPQIVVVYSSAPPPVQPMQQLVVQPHTVQQIPQSVVPAQPYAYAPVAHAPASLV